MRTPTELDREIWIDERYAELTSEIDDISSDDEIVYYDQACEDYNNMMADLAERARDERIDREMGLC